MLIVYIYMGIKTKAGHINCWFTINKRRRLDSFLRRIYLILLDFFIVHNVFFAWLDFLFKMLDLFDANAFELSVKFDQSLM